MQDMLRALAHIFLRIVVTWIAFLGTSPFGIPAQVVTLILSGVGITGMKFWQMQFWRRLWSSDALMRALKGLGIVWAFAFVVCTVTSVYDNHAALVTSNSGLRSTNEGLKRRAERVPALEQQVRDLQKKLAEKPQMVTRTVQIPCPIAGDAAELAGLQKAENARREKRRATRQVLAEGLAAGTATFELLYIHDLTDDAVATKVQQWIDSTEKHLHENLGDDYVIRFRSSIGIMGVSPSNNPASDMKRNLWWLLYYRTFRLTQFLEELKD